MRWPWPCSPARPPPAPLVGTTFGLVRALLILVVGRVRRPDQLRTALRRVHAWRPVSERIGIAVQGLVLVAAGAVAVAH